MDEPFGALDAQTKLTLEDVLMKLWSSHRKTVVFVTHDLAEAIALSDRVIVMSARPGRIVRDVPISLPRPRDVRALQKDPHFHELYAQLWALLEYGATDK
jgi:NitT/TauT family transport system ATP-binding protein